MNMIKIIYMVIGFHNWSVVASFGKQQPELFEAMVVAVASRQSWLPLARAGGTCHPLHHGRYCHQRGGSRGWGSVATGLKSLFIKDALWKNHLEKLVISWDFSNSMSPSSFGVYPTVFGLCCAEGLSFFCVFTALFNLIRDGSFQREHYSHKNVFLFLLPWNKLENI